jgi:hypothetical protein
MHNGNYVIAQIFVSYFTSYYNNPEILILCLIC